MISENTYTEEHIRNIQQRDKSDPILVEKVIMAFTLLEKLKLNGLEFVFKGGTSLLLLLSKIHRLSIDIDIVYNSGTNEDIRKVASKIVVDSIFTRAEENIRPGVNKIPKAHFKFYYNSVITKREEYVLLDVLFEENSYTRVIKLPISSYFLISEGDITFVNTPNINCILGDKLTAFAPNTIGIPFNKEKEVEIIKQLFDISNLFDESDDIAEVKDTFEKTVEKEAVYREKDGERYSIEDIYDDIYKTAETISFRGKSEKDSYAELFSGIRKITPFIFSRRFNIEDAVLNASKTAYLILLIRHGIDSKIEKYSKEINLVDMIIDFDRYLIFNRLKKINPEAFYYWYKAIELLKKHKVG